MRRLAIFLAASLSLTALHAAGLEDGDVVDAVMIHRDTGQPALILGVDKPVDTEAVEKQLDYKLGTYIGFVRSGDLYSRYPKANPSEKPLITIVFEYPPSERVRGMTFRARDRLVEMGFVVHLKAYDEAAKRNVDLAP
jgi:hypothetical protein